MTDERLRQRLASLSEPESTLDSEARDRVLAYVGEVGPKVVVRARRQRAAIQVGLVVGSVAAAAAVVWLVVPSEPTPPVPACTTWQQVASADLEGTQSLGTRGRLVSAPNTLGRIAAEGPCRTVLTLDAGRVRVEAHDLGGGELAVRTDEGVVDVHGTVFSVERQAHATIIDVEKGRVSWTAPQAAPIYLGANQRHTVQIIARNSAADSLADPGETVAEVPTLVPSPAPGHPPSTPEARKPRTKAAAPAAPTAKAATSASLIQQAEKLRRAGQTAEARAAYRAAGKHEDATAEAAWIALARYELELGHPQKAQQALRERKRRFASGVLALEAEWIWVRADDLAGDRGGAQARAERLIKRWPQTPQAEGAKAWLKANP